MASTGVIGQPLPIERIVRGHAAAGAPRARRTGFDDFARGDHDHRSLREARAAPRAARAASTARVVGVAKGAGMIAPNMATTLASSPPTRRSRRTFSARAPARRGRGDLQRDLRRRRHVDQRHARDHGSRRAPRTSRSKAATRASAFAPGAATTCSTSSRARSCATAKAPPTSSPSRCAARETAAAARRGGAPHRAPRRWCKTAFFGADPNWGRILCAIGNAGVPIEPDRHRGRASATSRSSRRGVRGRRGSTRARRRRDAPAARTRSRSSSARAAARRASSRAISRTNTSRSTPTTAVDRLIPRPAARSRGSIR